MARSNAAGQEGRGTTHRLMKRHERSSAGLLLLIVFTTSLLLQVSAQRSEEPSKEQVKTQTAVIQAKRKRSGLRPVHLQALPEYNTASVDPDHVVVWNNQQLCSKFKLDKNGTEVIIPKEAYYLINLRMSYRVPEETCPCVDNGEPILCYLNVSVMQYSDAYPKWLTVVEGKETMTCNEGSSQAINLVRVTFLSQNTKMRVIVAPKNLQLISWTSENYFEIIHLK